MRVNIKKLSFGIISILVLFLGNSITFYLFTESSPFEERIVKSKILVLVFIIIILLFSLNNLKITISKRKLKFILLWELFIISIFVSQNHNDGLSLLDFSLYGIVIPLVFMYGDFQKYKNSIIIASSLTAIPFLYLIGWWNGVGIVISVSGINMMNIMKIKQVKDKYIFLMLIVITILLYLIQSRTALISFLTVSFIYILLLILKRNKLLDLIKSTGILFLFLILAIFSYRSIYNLILNKRDSGKLIDARAEMWSETLKNGVTIFGNGESFFSNTFGWAHGHNIFIQVLGAYGLISFILFVTIIIYIMIWIYKLRHKKEYLYFFCIFFLIGLGENTLFINSHMAFTTILFFVYLGSMLNEKNIQKSFRWR